MPTLDSVEEYLRSAEEQFYSSLLTVTYSLPDVHDVLNQLWLDISRYGPGLPSLSEVHFPAFHPPPSPPSPLPPPPPTSWVIRSANWIEHHPWKATGFGVAGVGLLVGCGRLFARRKRHLRKSQKGHSGEHQQVIVVLGGDTPYGRRIIQEFEKNGYIVIASVSSSEAVETLESLCQGFVKALVLDPFEPATVGPFLRSLSATLSRKFPIKSAGDPYISPSSVPYIHSVISLLSLSSPVPNIFGPLEHMSLRDTYLPYLTATQITPLQVIQALLPLLRTGSARSKDVGKKSIIVCLPATVARAGLPFSSVQAMSAAGTLRAIEVLRREINISALTEKTESMQNIRVVVVDVGTFNIEPSVKSIFSEGIYKAMEDWTASEKLVYGPAFVAVMHEEPSGSGGLVKSVFGPSHKYGVQRKPTDLSVLANRLIAVVSEGRYGCKSFGHLGLGRVRYWIWGDRITVGAGSCTYKVASHLPSLLLDGLLSLPHFLISIRNRLLPLQPFREPFREPQPSPRETITTCSSDPGEQARDDHHDTSPAPEVEHNSSDADVENNAEDLVDSSWVSLRERSSDV